ncbi:hypothetical protein [Primorskyibacter flagellatus]|uniref:hypothetical protein n=1 Tax=Primorskyibacter flagellatus TaxID=1387277 RepID=UPI00166B813A|nr:hypothetical protein [Primorskyibacter flagellatus]
MPNPLPNLLRGVVAAVTLPVLAGQAAAQNLVIEPILMDVDAAGPVAAEPVLFAAYEAPAAAPRLGGATLQRAALKVAPGRPQPSIIVGLIDPGAEEDFGVETLLPATVDQFGFAFDDLVKRAAMRAEDPEMFRKLVEGGHLDPPVGEEARALQTEMARMSCYRMGIDGQWGPGSRRSVDSYFETLDNGLTRTEEDATPELFRTVLLNGDVDCPVPVAASPAPRASSSTSSRPAATSTARQSTPRAAPAPAAKPATNTGRLGRLGTGVLR